MPKRPAERDGLPESVLPAARLELMGDLLVVLASRPRLELLHVLRTPHLLSEIRITAAHGRGDERHERPMTRQAITKHLDALLNIGLIQRIDDGDRKTGPQYVLNHARLFSVVDSLRDLAKLKPHLSDAMVQGLTVEAGRARTTALPAGPRLVIAYGRDDGVAFPLHGPLGTRWRIGRAPACEICLDYDPFLSGVHATIERLESGFKLRDAQSRNRTTINGEPVPPHAAAELAPGDMITLGRSNLVFQP